LLYEALYHQKFNLELLFRATRDGFKSNAFHEKLDGKGNTIFLDGSPQGMENTMRQIQAMMTEKDKSAKS
jgi:hypothetical protein